MKRILRIVGYWIITNLIDVAIFMLLGWWMLIVLLIIFLIIILLSSPVFLIMITVGSSASSYLKFLAVDLVFSVFVFFVLKGLFVDRLYRIGTKWIKSLHNEVDSYLKSKRIN